MESRVGEEVRGGRGLAFYKKREGTKNLLLYIQPPKLERK